MDHRPTWRVACALALAPLGFALAHDFNGDGRADLFWRNAQTGANTIWLGANPATQQSVVGVGNLRWAVVGAGDFDGDGRDDLLWRNRSTGANVIWRAANAAAQTAMASVPNFDWTVAGVGDFDRDGRDDVLWRNVRTGANTIWLAGNALAPRTVANASLPAMVSGVGDFDGDGADDILWRNDTNGQNAWWSAGLLSRQRVLAATPRGYVAAVGDFDGDGFDDVLFRDTVLSDTFEVWNHADPARPSARTSGTPMSWSEVSAVGDFDADGQDDLLWREFTKGTNTLWRSAQPGDIVALTGVTNRVWLLHPYDAQPTRPLLFSMLGTTQVLAEGNTTRTLGFPTYLSHAVVVPVAFSFPYEITDDMTFPVNRIPPGETTWTARAQVNGDLVPEANETFVSTFPTAQGAEAVGPWPTWELRNDDGLTVWVESGSAYENAGPVRFTVRLSAPATAPVSFTISTAATPGDTAPATAGVDYVARSLAMTIPAGATQATFDVATIDDALYEADYERFSVVLSNVAGAVAVENPKIGYITDDENDPNTPF